MEQEYVEIDKKLFKITYPDQCPICKKSIYPKGLKFHNNTYKNEIIALFFCHACKNGFISYYTYEETNFVIGSIKHIPATIKSSYPNYPTTHEFEQKILNISSNFVTIYNQSEKAESEHLNEIAGAGYRKSFEFLIKDYCIFKKNYDEKESAKISKMPVVQVIEKYIDNPNIKNPAKIASWLGNDEVHYLRKYSDKDVQDLKILIETTVAFISYELSAIECEEMLVSR
mgnify:CR=1 FL=1